MAGVNFPTRILLPQQGSSGGLLIGGDANLYRSGSIELKTDNVLRAGQQFRADTDQASYAALRSLRSAANSILDNYLGADVFTAFQILGSGQINWGPGGSTAPDTNLYRAGADVLKTDDALAIAGAGE